MGKRFYIASKAGSVLREGQVQSLRNWLRSHGWECVFDWTEEEVFKPYTQYSEENIPVVESMSKAVRTVDVFIVLLDESGVGLFMENGMAIMSHILTGRPETICVIGEECDRSVFNCSLDYVRRFKDTPSCMDYLESLM